MRISETFNLGHLISNLLLLFSHSTAGIFLDYHEQNLIVLFHHFLNVMIVATNFNEFTIIALFGITVLEFHLNFGYYLIYLMSSEGFFWCLTHYLKIFVTGYYNDTLIYKWNWFRHPSLKIKIPVNHSVSSFLAKVALRNLKITTHSYLLNYFLFLVPHKII